jgi:hypothetical protein
VTSGLRISASKTFKNKRTHVGNPIIKNVPCGDGWNPTQKNADDLGMVDIRNDRRQLDKKNTKSPDFFLAKVAPTSDEGQYTLYYIHLYTMFDSGKEIMVFVVDFTKDSTSQAKCERGLQVPWIANCSSMPSSLPGRDGGDHIFQLRGHFQAMIRNLMRTSSLEMSKTMKSLGVLAK